ncbi:MAG: helix-turn-helix transcriptional regulator [Endomicrobium sp.]|jgi:transcriptional regulator with XRE-family HTH domain|nr:helix-turn-helix transcriptional regulator [Endomicrobium sp.]
MKKEIAEKIRIAMHENSITQKDLGRTLGLKQAAVSKIVRGITNTTLPQLEKIAKATKKNLNYFINTKGQYFSAFGDNTQIHAQAAEDIKNYISKISELEKENAYLKGKIEILERIKK